VYDVALYVLFRDVEIDEERRSERAG